MNDSRQNAEHENVWLLLPWYANGTLDAVERRQVDGHLAGCVSCRDEAARCAGIAAALREGAESAPSPHPIQLARLMERIAASTAHDALDSLADLDGKTSRDATASLDANSTLDARDERAENPALAALDPRAELDGRDGNGGRGANRAPRAASANHGLALPAPRPGRAAVLGSFGSTPRWVRVALVGQLAAMLLLAVAFAVRPMRPAPPAPPAPMIYHVLASPAPPATAATSANIARIRLVFTETATEKQIREVLLRTRGRLVDGPSPLGTYTLAVPTAAEATPDSLGVVLAYLRGQPVVRFAEPIDGAGLPTAAPAAPAPAAGPRLGPRLGRSGPGSGDTREATPTPGTHPPAAVIP